MPKVKPNRNNRRNNAAKRKLAAIARQEGQKNDREGSDAATADTSQPGALTTSQQIDWLEQNSGKRAAPSGARPPSRSKSKSPATPKRGSTPPARRVGFHDALAARQSDGKSPMTPLTWDLAAAKASGTVHPSAKAGAIPKAKAEQPKAKSKSPSLNRAPGGKGRGKAKKKGQKGKGGKPWGGKDSGKQNATGVRKIVFKVPGKGTRKGGGRRGQQK